MSKTRNTATPPLNLRFSRRFRHTRCSNCRLKSSPSRNNVVHNDSCRRQNGLNLILYKSTLFCYNANTTGRCSWVKNRAKLSGNPAKLSGNPGKCFGKLRIGSLFSSRFQRPNPHTFLLFVETNMQTNPIFQMIMKATSHRVPLLACPAVLCVAYRQTLHFNNPRRI